MKQRALLISSQKPKPQPPLIYVSVNNTNVGEVVSELMTYKTKHKVVIGDYASLSPNNRQVLLKFIEDYTEDAVMHTTEDCVTPILLSRFLVVKKVSDITLIDPPPVPHVKFASYVMSLSLPFYLRKRLTDIWNAERGS